MTQHEQAGQDRSVEDFIADSDTGGRMPRDAFGKAMLWYIPLVWSVYQLWIASPLPFILKVGVWNDTQTRAIHLGFAVLLAFIAFPGLKSSPRYKIPVPTWLIAIVGALASSYLFYNYVGVANRSGAPNQMDVWVSVVGIILLMEAARRSLGFPLMGVALFFLAYVFFGSSTWLPEVVQWKGASLNKAMSHMWLTTEGVFGVALGVSSGFVFLFVLFGALLNQAGAGNYFLQLAFAALGHLRGGPAKAAVIASAATGLISGSSIANVVTTGTFTIPLMKKVGFPATKAGAVEVSSSINGVLTPPVMGAVAFLMTEYVGISYVEVVKTAIVPAAISYVALVYIVHLEALKMGMTGTSRMHPVKFILGAIFIIATSIVIAGGTLWLCGVIVNGAEAVFGDASVWVIVAAMIVLYVLAVRFAAGRADLEMSIESMQHLPPAREIFKTGIHYIMPILLLMYLLMIERKSPGLSAFWSAIAMLVILLTQNPLKAYFRGQSDIGGQLRKGWDDITEGLIAGARNMIGLACAMGVAGIIVGAVTLTGIGQVMAEFVEFLSGGNLLAMLFFVALISIILGMGLPTTANYIVVSSLMAGVVVELGAQSGLIVPLVAVHMFVFYFGIMADVTPPVGLASFAAAAISKGDPLRTGFQAFFYSIRTALLPFLFIFNTDLLLIDVGPVQAVFVFIVALIAMLLFAAGTMNYFMVKSKLWESAALLLVAFTLFQPGFWLDRVAPKYTSVSGAEALALMAQQPDATDLRLLISGPDFSDSEITPTTIIVPAKSGDAEGALMDQGLAVLEEEGQLLLEEPFPGTPHFDTLGNDYDFYGNTPVTITAVEVENDRILKEVFFVPAFLLLGLVFLMQMGRKRKEEEGVPA
ncbi:MAG: TRAP transporter permease [Pelagimonas sp.]|jgi:TRAP transporter 4TM/12TM fusion protein|nr:TRAP transporter permease [Pelagimonas sp.]